MQWSDGWQQATLRAVGVPVTQYALDVLNAWQQSTPTQPWTNNPLGYPAAGSAYPKALDTPYAVMPTMDEFRAAFKRVLKTGNGQSVLNVLLSGDSYSDAWREIHALGWPANATESDYPTALLDLVTDAYRKKVQAKSGGQNNSAGQMQASPATHTAIKAQAQALNHAAQSFSNGADAITYLVRRLG